MRIHHKNLTSLVGYCNEGTNMGIIYEYMANQSLDEYLSGKCCFTVDSNIFVENLQKLFKIFIHVVVNSCIGLDKMKL